jgi:hypothetical protein
MRALFLAMGVSGLILSGCVVAGEYSTGGSLNAQVANIKNVNGEEMFNLCKPKMGMSTDTLTAMCGEPDRKLKSVAYDGNTRKDECWIYRTWAANAANAPYIAACFANRTVEGSVSEDPGGVRFEVTQITGLSGLPESAPPPAPPAPPTAPAPISETTAPAGS